MEILLYIVLAVSVVGNVWLVVRNAVWKGRAHEVIQAIGVTNQRLGLTFELLWKQAQAKGATDKNEFTGKIIFLSQMPTEIGLNMAEQILPIATENKASMGFK